MQQALGPRGQGAKLENNGKLRRLINGGHVVFLLFLFAPPLTLCVAMGVEVDVAFFIGRWSWAGLIILPMILAMSATTHVRKSRAVVLAAIWVPAAILALIGGLYRARAEITAASLESRDCFAFQDKRQLQRAYQVADELWEACVNQVVLPASADSPPKSVRDCPAYPGAMAEWGVQFQYLEGLESRFQCAGICHRGKRLWNEAGQIAPSCGPFVAQWLHAAHSQAAIVLWYSVFVILLMFPGHIFLLMPLFEQCNAEKAAPQY
mmetsp:Transcript_46583/g.123025  ORF Transcript_46583/g.123025 Transcript_46583/m.123025 type:complete len:264 (+) Transcript_46583:127-918(+)